MAEASFSSKSFYKYKKQKHFILMAGYSVSALFKKFIIAFWFYSKNQRFIKKDYAKQLRANYKSIIFFYN